MQPEVTPVFCATATSSGKFGECYDTSKNLSLREKEIFEPNERTCNFAYKKQQTLTGKTFELSNKISRTNLRGRHTLEYMDLENRNEEEAYGTQAWNSHPEFNFKENILKVDQLLTMENPQEKQIRLSSEVILAGPKLSDKYAHFLQCEASSAPQTVNLRQSRLAKD